MSIDSEFSGLILSAWQGKLDFTGLLDHASRLTAQGRAPLAAVLYQTWLNRNTTTNRHFALFNLGALLFSEGDLEAAKEAYLEAIRLAPSFFQPRFNLGLTYEKQGNIEAAMAEWHWIDDHVPPGQSDNRPILLMALNNLGRVLEDRKQLFSANACLTKSLIIEPRQPDVLHHLVYLREKQCSWPVYAPIPGVDPELMRRSTSALAMISLSDDPEAQLNAAREYVKNKVLTDVSPLSERRSYGHKKLRIGYCSSDFCLHPVAMLTAELFELHDRDRFEVFGFCWTKQGHSDLRQRIMDGMDHFIRIDTLSDEAAARAIRAHEIDILVDLHGQTLGARPNILSYRPAPIQITYLGLPATTGFPSIDYVIADRFLIPEEHARYYSEKPLYMPDVYQVSDRRRNHAFPPARKECGLPDDGFVFCTFNNNYKYTPEMFDSWMDILRRVSGSVLWMLSDNPWAEANLRHEAISRGIAGYRLIFAPRVSPDQYLARYTIADLFLDSFPFNAGTTANDALWMGLPVLTRCGRTFASRMAGALLTAAGLPELISNTLSDYVEKAVELAHAPGRCRHLRERLRSVRENGVLFDTPRFVRNLERELERLVVELG